MNKTLHLFTDEGVSSFFHNILRNKVPFSEPQNHDFWTRADLPDLLFYEHLMDHALFFSNRITTELCFITVT